MYIRIRKVEQRWEEVEGKQNGGGERKVEGGKTERRWSKVDLKWREGEGEVAWRWREGGRGRGGETEGVEQSTVEMEGRQRLQRPKGAHMLLYHITYLPEAQNCPAHCETHPAPAEQ